MKCCIFCGDFGVGTTSTSTTTEAYPFLCAQLQLPVREKGCSSPVTLCRSCHNLWEEVTILYSNMQGLVNLMGRRVGQIQNKLKKGTTKGKGGPSRKDGETEILGWWYPNAANGQDLDGQEVVCGGDVVVEMDEGEGPELEDFAINPDSEDQDDQDQKKYGPGPRIELVSSHQGRRVSTRRRNKPGKFGQTNKNKTVEPDGTDELPQQRKRIAISDKIKEENKLKRMRGEEYVAYYVERKVSKSKTGETATKQLQIQSRNARRLGAPCRSTHCAKSQFRSCNLFTESMRQQIFHEFWTEMDWNEKKDCIGSLVDVANKKTESSKDSKRKDTMLYHLKLSGTKVQICRNMFLSTLGIRQKQLLNWVRQKCKALQNDS